MQKIIVSDASSLILFDKIGELTLLKTLFGEILITETVLKEFNTEIPDWIKVTKPKTNIHLGLQTILDEGEATSISLATDYPECLLIIDELKGRIIAKELGIRITGSLGILILAKEKSITTSVKVILDKIKKTNFRISDELEKAVLLKAGE